MKRTIVPVLSVLFALSCTPAEKSESTDTTKLEASTPAPLTTTPAAATTQSPKWNTHTLISILEQDSVIQPNAANYASVMTEHTIDLDSLDNQNEIVGIGFAFNGEEAEYIMIAFFDVSNEPKLVAYQHLGPREEAMVTYESIELAPGQFAAVVNWSTSSQENSNDRTIISSSTNVSLYVLSGTEVVDILDYSSASSENIQGPEGSGSQSEDQTELVRGQHQAGMLCSITLSSTGKTSEGSDDGYDQTSSTQKYIFNKTAYELTEN